jgi:hypothetical protein
MHSVVQNPTETLSEAEIILHKKISSHILTIMPTEGNGVSPAEVH